MQAKYFLHAPNGGGVLYRGLGEHGGKSHTTVLEVLVEPLRCSVIRCIWETFCSAH